MKKAGYFLLLLILIICIAPLLYKNTTIYTYYVNDKFGKSKDCLIDENDFRICKVKGEYIKVELYYEEI